MLCRVRCAGWRRLGQPASMPWQGIGEGEEQTLLPKIDRQHYPIDDLGLPNGHGEGVNNKLVKLLGNKASISGDFSSVSSVGARKSDQALMEDRLTEGFRPTRRI